jgi:hypothetical protein
MVFLAQSAPGCRSTRSLQIKKATVMLGQEIARQCVADGADKAIFALSGINEYSNPIGGI